MEKVLTENEPLIWSTVKRRVGDLIPWEKNPREISDKECKELTKSLEKFGYVETIIIDADNTIIGGHQRRDIFVLEKKQDLIIEVRMPNRKLTEADFKELNVRLNLNKGEFKPDALVKHFQIDELLSYGFDSLELDSLLALGGVKKERKIKEVAPGEEPVESAGDKTVNYGTVNNYAAPKQGDEEQEVHYEIFLNNSTREKLYSILSQIKKEKGIMLSKDAFDYLVTNFKI